MCAVPDRLMVELDDVRSCPTVEGFEEPLVTLTVVLPQTSWLTSQPPDWVTVPAYTLPWMEALFPQVHGPGVFTLASLPAYPVIVAPCDPVIAMDLPPYSAPRKELPVLATPRRTSVCILRIEGRGDPGGEDPLEVMTAPAGFAVSGQVIGLPLGGYVV
jgi:hypothetical protein